MTYILSTTSFIKVLTKFCLHTQKPHPQLCILCKYIEYEMMKHSYLLVSYRCLAWEAGCFKCPTLHIGRVDSWTRWPSPPWPLTLVTCSNVAPHVDWRNFFSIPICFFWYRVSTHVLLCHTDSYPVWRNSVGQHLLYLSKFCMSRWGHLAASFSSVKSA